MYTHNKYERDVKRQRLNQSLPTKEFITRFNELKCEMENTGQLKNEEGRKVYTAIQIIKFIAIMNCKK